MKIPKQFKLLGQTIQVVFDEGLRNNSDVWGLAEYRANKIRIQISTDGAFRTEEQIGETFCHELMHWVLYYAGSSYKGNTDFMHQDEALVDMAGGLLHQALITMEYED